MSEDSIAFHGIVWTENTAQRPEDGKLTIRRLSEGKHPAASANGDDVEKKADSGELSSKDASKSELTSTPEIEYPRGIRLVIITISVAISIFLVALDQNIITTAMYVLWIRDS